ncbi:MAG: hypothetical protein HQL30_03885 [Candidatus Omnitrophica bacterium]|nr:hypothetical protein [Candidatus Omnitrophota bacterium]
MAGRDKKEIPLLNLIQDLKDSRIDPGTIDKELRQQCIEVFLGEGYSVPSIAQIFMKCDKTIRRDIEEIRDRNGLVPSLDLAKKTVGEVVVYARIHRDHLMRLARSRDTSVSERAQAEYFAHRVDMEVVDKLQTLGYLPLKPKTIVGDFTHTLNVSDDKVIHELKNQLCEVERIASEGDGMTADLEQEVKQIKLRIAQAEIEKDILAVRDEQQKGENNG